MFNCIIIEDDIIYPPGYENNKVVIEIIDEIIPVKNAKCVIPGCKNVGKNKYNFCMKHNKEYKFEKPDECCVCLENLDNEKYPLRSCGHWIHHNCVILSGKDECPCCRGKVSLNKEQQKELKNIKNKNNNERIEEEERELRRVMELERTVINRRTNWIDERDSTDFFRGGRRTQERIQSYLNSDERIATITHLQDLMLSPNVETRNDATILFEMQNVLNRLSNTELRISRRMFSIFMGVTGVIEGEIRGRVIDQLLN